MLSAEFLAPELSEVEIQLREAFVREYFKDFDETKACIRLGYQISFAIEFGQRYLEEPFVQRLIADKRAALTLPPEKQLEQDKALIIETLRQACVKGQYATRVAAAKQLAIIHGLDKTESDGGEEQLIRAFKEVAVGLAGLDKQ